MTQFGTVYPTTRNGGITNGREIGAYVIAQAIKLGLTLGVSQSRLLTPVYSWAYQREGMMAIVVLGVAISLFWAAVVLILFLALRGALGGVPTMIAAPGREHAVTSREGEIGAYVIAFVLLIAVLTVLNSVVLGPIYVSLNHAGQESIAIGVSLSVWFIGAAVVYAGFIGLRAAFCGRGR